MYVDYLSDIHIDHHVRFQENQRKWEVNTREFTRKLIEKQVSEDIIVVAGDISESIVQTYWFLDELDKHYDCVLFVLGNHDYYLNSNAQVRKYENYQTKIKVLKETILDCDNVHLLDKSIVEYKGFKFAGDTLWYYPEGFKDKQFYLNHMPDSRFIHSGDDKTPLEILWELHVESMKWFNTLKSTSVDVLVTHVPPIDNPMSPFRYNECFVTPTRWLPTNHWVVGHQHTQFDFSVLHTNFYANPIGYPNENEKMEVKTFKIG